jgi:hypothetical protein
VRPNKNKVGHEPASQRELIRSATGMACVRLWTRVVLQILMDIDIGVRILRAVPTPNLAASASRSARVKDAQAAAMWLFGSAARHDRAWICDWIDIEPKRLQEMVLRTHGHAVNSLLAKRP